jgi:hypothetical protein
MAGFESQGMVMAAVHPEVRFFFGFLKITCLPGGRWPCWWRGLTKERASAHARARERDRQRDGETERR